MKYIVFTAISLFVSSSLLAQNVIDRHFDYLLLQEDVTNVNINGKMFELLNNISVEVDSEEDEELQEMQEFLSSIRSFQLVAAKPTSARKSFVTGKNSIEKDYEELLSVQDKEGSFFLYIDEHNGTVHEVVGIGTDNDKLMVFSLLGSMKLEQVGKVASHIQDTGIDQLSKVKDFEIDQVKVYPNPAKANGNFTLESSEAFDNGVANLYDSNGSLVKTYRVNSTNEQHDLGDLSEGNYILQLTKNDISIKKKIIVVR